MAKVLIMGCGDIGYAVGEHLQQQGIEVEGAKRAPISDSAFFIHTVDVLHQDTLNGLPRHVNEVLIILSPDGPSEQDYHNTFIKGLHNVLDYYKLEKDQLGITFVSSSRVYGQDDGSWCDETTEPKPSEAKGRLLKQAEDLALQFSPRTTIVRFAGIYGRSQYLLQKVKNNDTVQKQPAYYTNRIHREDCIGLLSLVVQKKLRGESVPPIILGVDDEPATQWDVMNYLAEKMKMSKRIEKTVGQQASQNKRLRNNALKSIGYVLKYPHYKTGFQVLFNDN